MGVERPYTNCREPFHNTATLKRLTATPNVSGAHAPLAWAYANPTSRLLNPSQKRIEAAIIRTRPLMPVGKRLGACGGASFMDRHYSRSGASFHRA